VRRGEFDRARTSGRGDECGADRADSALHVPEEDAGAAVAAHVPVEERDVGSRLRACGDPVRDDARGASGDNDRVRALGQDGLRARLCIESDVDGESRELGGEPADVTAEMRAIRRTSRGHDLAAEHARPLEQHDVVPALGGHPGRLHARGAAADDDKPPCRRRR
jgi:hypothetical protein